MPTIVRSPCSTLMSCGRLSMRVQQRNAPIGVSGGGLDRWPLQGMAFGTEAKQLKFMALRSPLFPLREHRAGAVQLDGKRYDDHQRQGHSDQNDSDYKITDPRHRIHRRFLLEPHKAAMDGQSAL